MKLIKPQKASMGGLGRRARLQTRRLVLGLTKSRGSWRIPYQVAIMSRGKMG